MKIGQFEIKTPVFLAPMAGITDQPFRRICANYGAGLTFSEMMSTNPQVWHTEKSKFRLAHHQEIGINAVQIVGSDPIEMAMAAQVNVEYGAEIIDINMGCPAKKVNRKIAGSALLQYPNLVQRILENVVDAVSVPVTLKIRTGWDQKNRNCIQIAKIAEQAGIQALTIHGRTRECLFQGKAEYEHIKAVKQAVSIPVIANGDIDSAQKAEFVLDYTAADAVMIGRGALGQPWLFREVKELLESNTKISTPDITEKREVILQHIAGLHQFYGAEKGYRIARKHVGWYLDHLQIDSGFKRAFNMITNPSEQLATLKAFLMKIQ
ncbi:tRNA dihydrouridine synthase DusB [Mergibacter septicus]|uniref:tRNA-dihydrouridine synthase B n=1 Tax=Mergibacter septicus TaxID=221402 RepID=A0A8E3MCS6_9PAST|nr:tRNA dihydrouridine synthase DusB [Mergibacter septicus]AWX15451.1 tRNA dihydrouridine synthase DusB [Mergibacter septicus]QDJ12930.1 tRNA dihydrouridine synthase DusB [Mergibacter septicus]QDJ14704.1 tRNA dihydrouridine synthase DusB [Mergibacter septicus]UTU47868.1 tRNA dihydrouridine synthase DusB [Mergibacter septicus]WMR96525.1 tRNA dihydrouridine synthase DusB [Mergibacter septicus]